MKLNSEKVHEMEKPEPAKEIPEEYKAFIPADFRDPEEDDEDEDDCDCCDGDLYEIVCPSCGDSIYLDEGMVDEGEMDCPNCGEHLEFDFDDEEEESEEDGEKE